MAVEASIVVEFGDEDASNSSLKIEIDDQHENNQYTDDDGEIQVYSSFAPDGEPVIIIHHDSTVQITDVKSTDGSMEKIGSNVSRTRESDSVFTSSTTEVDTGYVGMTGLSAEWFGNSCSVSIDSDETTTIVTSSGTYPAYGNLSFNVTFQEQWKITPPSMELDDDESYTIYIVVYVESVT